MKKAGKPWHLHIYTPCAFPTGTSNSPCSTVFIGKHDLLSQYYGLGPETTQSARQILSESQGPMASPYDRG